MKTQREGSDNAILSIQGLTKLFGSGPATVRAVDGIDLAIRRGEVVLIMGPSGSGKTTLLTMIGGLLKPSSGSVRINGLDITAKKESQLTHVRRHFVGFVFQTFNLLESLNAEENVELALNFAGITGKAARDRATQLLVDLGMEGRLRFKPRELSGGEKQRVSIARALANEPQVILADEPTANLDSKHGQEIALLLRDIAKKQNRTIVIVSHDLRIREVADRVLWLEDGCFKDLVWQARDPVCGKAVEEAMAVSVSHWRGHSFCSERCLREFEASPEKFAARMTFPVAFVDEGRNDRPRPGMGEASES